MAPRLLRPPAKSTRTLSVASSGPVWFIMMTLPQTASAWPT
ncbi:hypothetical protein EVA_12480 [gut metagenome]|uniref:Uncharacterized protein n=1 Tax=gut metagenome TaxID=749906 RepID=J9CH68_9ZZZZ